MSGANSSSNPVVTRSDPFRYSATISQNDVSTTISGHQTRESPAATTDLSNVRLNSRPIPTPSSRAGRHDRLNSRPSTPGASSGRTEAAASTTVAPPRTATRAPRRAASGMKPASAKTPGATSRARYNRAENWRTEIAPRTRSGPAAPLSIGIQPLGTGSPSTVRSNGALHRLIDPVDDPLVEHGR